MSQAKIDCSLRTPNSDGGEIQPGLSGRGKKRGGEMKRFFMAVLHLVLPFLFSQTHKMIPSRVTLNRQTYPQPLV